MVAIGDRHIERVAQDINGAGGQLHRDQGPEAVEGERIVSLHKSRIGMDLSNGLMRLAPCFADFLLGPVPGRATDERGIPTDGGIVGAKIGDAVDIVSVLRVAQEVVQEGPEPGVPRLRVRSEPDNLAHVPPASAQFSGK